MAAGPSEPPPLVAVGASSQPPLAWTPDDPEVTKLLEELLGGEDSDGPAPTSAEHAAALAAAERLLDPLRSPESVPFVSYGPQDPTTTLDTLPVDLVMLVASCLGSGDLRRTRLAVERLGEGSVCLFDRAAYNWSPEQHRTEQQRQQRDERRAVFVRFAHAADSLTCLTLTGWRVNVEVFWIMLQLGACLWGVRSLSLVAGRSANYLCELRSINARTIARQLPALQELVLTDAQHSVLDREPFWEDLPLLRKLSVLGAPYFTDEAVATLQRHTGLVSLTLDARLFGQQVAQLAQLCRRSLPHLERLLVTRDLTAPPLHHLYIDRQLADHILLLLVPGLKVLALPAMTDVAMPGRTSKERLAFWTYILQRMGPRTLRVGPRFLPDYAFRTAARTAPHIFILLS